MLDVATARIDSFLCAACDAPVQLDGASSPVKCGACGKDYAWSDGILVINDDAIDEDYPEESYDLLVAAQERHFWFGARNHTIVSAMKESIGTLRGLRILDVGCGDGYVTQALEREGAICCGLDMYIEGLRYARGRMQGLLVQDTAARIPFENQFDIVTFFDVIEHVDDDVGLLQAALRALKPGGDVVITVPAHQSLWTQLDDASGHKRRYSRDTLARSMRAAGLGVTLNRYFNVLLHPVQIVQRKLMHDEPAGPSQMRNLAKQSLRVPPGPVNTVFGWLAAADPLLGRLNTPLGTSIVAIGRPS